MVKYSILLLFAVFITTNIFSQDINTSKAKNNKPITEKKQKHLTHKEKRKLKNIKPYNPLAPTKAAFYSAILPGLGQAYTGKYWKIPIVYGALGTGIGFAIWNQREYDRFRDIYKKRQLGISNDTFQSSNEAIQSKADDHKKDRDLSILLTVLAYALNIVDANVTAHLQQHNTNDNLTIKPDIRFNDYTLNPQYGLALSYDF